MIPGYVNFEFNLPEALLARLIQILDGMEPATLEPAHLTDIPDAQGVYQLFLDDRLVYIGKTDADAGLRNRLNRHHLKIQHRIGLDPARVSFKAVRIYVFTAVDLETQLIAHYGGYKTVLWNGSGFGSNDPGKERDTTTYKSNHFDSIFPIDISRPLDIDFPDSGSAADILALLKSNLPYVFRIENAGPRSRKFHSDLGETIISGKIGVPHTALRVIEKVVNGLPPGWQAIQLPSHLILYKHDNRKFPQGRVIASSPA